MARKSILGWLGALAFLPLALIGDPATFLVGSGIIMRIKTPALAFA